MSYEQVKKAKVNFSSPNYDDALWARLNLFLARWIEGAKSVSSVGLKDTEAAILTAIHTTEAIPLSQEELSQLIGSPQTYISKALVALRARGLCRTVTLKKGSRSNYHVLTTKGRSALMEYSKTKFPVPVGILKELEKSPEFGIITTKFNQLLSKDLSAKVASIRNVH